MPTKYTFTGQYNYVDDPSTSATEGFGLIYYGARWYDPSLGRFAQADTEFPAIQGTQAYDRYAYTSNNPLRYTDPTGHRNCEEDGYECPGDESPQDQALDIATDAVVETPNVTWWGLTDEQRQVLEEGGWTEGVYEDFRNGGVSDADFWHDPATYIVGAVGIAGLMKAAYAAIVMIGAQLATQNPDGVNAVIGGYPEYTTFGQASGNTYFSLGNAYNGLNALGLANPINSQFISNQIAQGKTILQVSAGGGGTATEVSQITSSGLYTSIGSAWSGFLNIFQPIIGGAP